MNVIQFFLGLALLVSPVVALAQTQDTSSASASVQVADVSDASKVLPSQAREKFASMRSDPDPAQLVRNAHYWVSNEDSHFVWRPHIQNMGGVLSGVGTDQIYLLAGWSRPAVIVPLDFDRKIRDLHFAYGAAFLAAETPEAFLALWTKNGAKDMKAAIDAAFPAEAKIIHDAYKTAQSTVNTRLRRVIKQYKALDIPTFLTDENEYRAIRQLWQNQRVFPICGDLTGNRAMLDLAKALEETGLKLTILYPSNAEHYFSYGPEYRRNILALPFANNGLVLRTRQMGSLGLAAEGDYHYNMQSGENFKIWLKTTRINDQHSMLRRRSKTSTTGLSVLDIVPDPSDKPPTIAAMP
ncbi:MAG: hypothetical protein FWC40_03910 [Proteobacteria bacterium]|nr:hypothetical protein [Pseudomonadota bacterium]